MKPLQLLALLGMSITFGTYSYAQNTSDEQNCIKIYNSGLTRSHEIIEINAANNNDQAKNLEALHNIGYFYKEINEKIRQLSFGATENYTALKYTITELGKKHRRISNIDLVNETWSFCQ